MKSITQLKKEKAEEIYTLVRLGKEVEFDGLYFRTDGRFVMCYDENGDIIQECSDSTDIAGLLHSDNFIG